MDVSLPHVHIAGAITSLKSMYCPKQTLVIYILSDKRS